MKIINYSKNKKIIDDSNVPGDVESVWELEDGSHIVQTYEGGGWKDPNYREVYHLAKGAYTLHYGTALMDNFTDFEKLPKFLQKIIKNNTVEILMDGDAPYLSYY